jgi:hypothetical protein
VVGEPGLRTALAEAAGRRITALGLDAAGDRAAELLLGLHAGA